MDRQKHIEFIEKDTKERGETIVSDIVFLGKIYETKVKIEGRKSRKTVSYTAGTPINSKYREIQI